MAPGPKRRKRSLEVRESAVFSFADYLQLACMTRRSVHLSAISQGQTLGGVIILTGEIWHAWDETGDGTEAFKRLALVDCEVSVMPHSGQVPPRTVAGSWERLMMDAAVEKDELSRSAPPSPASGVTAAKAVKAPIDTRSKADEDVAETEVFADEELVNSAVVTVARSAISPEAPACVAVNECTQSTGVPSRNTVKARDSSAVRSTIAESTPPALLTQTTLLSPLARPSVAAQDKLFALRLRVIAIAAGVLWASFVSWNLFLEPELRPRPQTSTIAEPFAAATKQPSAKRPAVNRLPVGKPPNATQPTVMVGTASPLAIGTESPEALPLVTVPEAPSAVKAPVPHKRGQRRSRRSASQAAKKSAPLASKPKTRNSTAVALPAAQVAETPSEGVGPQPAVSVIGFTSLDNVLIPRSLTTSSLPATAVEPTERSTAASTNSPSASAKASPRAPAPQLSRSAELAPISPFVEARIFGFRVVGPPSSDKLSDFVIKARRSFVQCYRSASLAAGRNGYGELAVQVTVDGRGHLSAAKATGGKLPGLNRCVAAVAGKLRIRRRPGGSRIQLKWTISYGP